MFTHAIYHRNEANEWTFDRYENAFVIANDAATYDDGCSDMTVQDILDIMARTTTCFFGEGEEMEKVVQLDEPLFEDQYGEKRTASEIEDQEADWRDYAATMDSINKDWWKAIDRASRNGFEL